MGHVVGSANQDRLLGLCFRNTVKLGWKDGSGQDLVLDLQGQRGQQRDVRVELVRALSVVVSSIV